jgi:hypothetical protein
MISGTGSTLFEELGFYYIGPVDGHNLQDLVDVLQGARGCGHTSMLCAGAANQVLSAITRRGLLDGPEPALPVLLPSGDLLIRLAVG